MNTLDNTALEADLHRLYAQTMKRHKGQQDGARLLPRLIELVRVQTATGWQEGNPVEVFIKDRRLCVRYESGHWWHYDIVGRTWF